MLGMLSAPASHCKHVTNLVNQLVSKNVIGVVDVHRCVSVSMSVSVNATGSKDVEYMNKINFDVLCGKVSFQKR